MRFYANFPGKYIFLGCNDVFLVIASFTYGFIFEKLRQNNRDIKRIRKQVNICFQKKKSA